MNFVACFGVSELFNDLPVRLSAVLCVSRVDMPRMTCSLVETHRSQLSKYGSVLMPLVIRKDKDTCIHVEKPVAIERSQRVEFSFGKPAIGKQSFWGDRRKWVKTGRKVIRAHSGKAILVLLMSNVVTHIFQQL